MSKTKQLSISTTLRQNNPTGLALSKKNKGAHQRRDRAAFHTDNQCMISISQVGGAFVWVGLGSSSVRDDDSATLAGRSAFLPKNSKE